MYLANDSDDTDNFNHNATLPSSDRPQRGSRQTLTPLSPLFSHFGLGIRANRPSSSTFNRPCSDPSLLKSSTRFEIEFHNRCPVAVKKFSPPSSSSSSLTLSLYAVLLPLLRPWRVVNECNWKY